MMSYESETDYCTSYYRCIDPIENFKIKVNLKPVKNIFIPLPQFDLDQGSGVISVLEEESQEKVFEEYTFTWQEKILSRSDFKKYTKDPVFKKHFCEKYNVHSLSSLEKHNNYPEKLFTYVDVDNYSYKKIDLNNVCCRNVKSISVPKLKNIINVPKTKIINYNPSNKNQMCDIDTKIHQKMFIMADLSNNNSDLENEEKHHHLLCVLSYNTESKLLEMTPSFSKNDDKPYVVGIKNQDSRNSYYYWLFHASEEIPTVCLRNEIKIMSKVLTHQNEMRKLLIGTDFFIGKPNHLYISILGEIVSAENFEYDKLHIKYFLKLPTGWKCSNLDSLNGSTQTSCQNSLGIAHFSHLFEMNFVLDPQEIEDNVISSPEIIFDISSIDKYNTCRNEGYAYICVPENPGMYKYVLKCWRAVSKKIRPQLERLFIGGGPELENISYAGCSNTQKSELISRLGFETIPTGKITFNLNIVHQSDILKKKNLDQTNAQKQMNFKSDAGTILSSINTVLEAFRNARAKMLEAKKGLEP